MGENMSDVVRVKIKKQTTTSLYGTLETGDILYTGREYAKHLVEDCDAGEYMDGGNAEDKQEERKTKPKKIKINNPLGKS